MDKSIIARAAIALTACFSLWAVPVTAEQLRFSGQSTADMALIKDTLGHIQVVGQGQRDCGVISAVDASILPEGYSPADSGYRVGQGKVTYESWSATMCGETVKFLISFWPASDGGTMFAVGYTYPSDAP